MSNTFMLYLSLFLGGAGFGLGALAFIKSHIATTLLNDIKADFEAKTTAVISNIKSKI